LSGWFVMKMKIIFLVAVLIGTSFLGMVTQGSTKYIPPWEIQHLYNVGSGQTQDYTMFWNAGDYVSVTITNYTGPGTGTVGVYGFNYEYYYNRAIENTADNGCGWDASKLKNTDTLVCWIIFVTSGTSPVHAIADNGPTTYNFIFHIQKSKYSLNYGSDTDIKNLQNQIDNMKSNVTNIQNQITSLTSQFNALNTTVNNLNNTQKQILTNITNLWMSFDKLNISLTDLTKTVNNLNSSTFQNITWLGQNITKIKSDISDIQNSIDKLSTNKTDISNLQYQINQTVLEIKKTDNNITTIQKAIPNAYNDTALKNQIAQLQKENSQLKSNIDTLNKTKNEKIIEKKADNAISYGAIALSIVALIVAIIAIMSRMPKTPSKDDRDVASVSKDYDEVEDKPKDIPKAKAKKKKEEDLDDVMKKLKE
jgi:predicted  nucleic acid-binding Zn-ribbon protein